MNIPEQHNVLGLKWTKSSWTQLAQCFARSRQCLVLHRAVVSSASGQPIAWYSSSFLQSFMYFSSVFCWFRYPSDSQEDLSFQCYYFSPKRELRIFWKERRMVRNSFRKTRQGVDRKSLKEKQNCAVPCPLVFGGWRARISLILEPQVFCCFFFNWWQI